MYPLLCGRSAVFPGNLNLLCRNVQISNKKININTNNKVDGRWFNWVIENVRTNITGILYTGYKYTS